MASVFVLLETFNRKGAAALEIFLVQQRFGKLREGKRRALDRVE